MIEFKGIEVDDRTERNVAVLTIPLGDVKRLHSALAIATGRLPLLPQEVAKKYAGLADDLEVVFDQLVDRLLDERLSQDV